MLSNSLDLVGLGTVDNNADKTDFELVDLITADCGFAFKSSMVTWGATNSSFSADKLFCLVIVL